MPEQPDTPPESLPAAAVPLSIDRELGQLRRRIIREATTAVDMLETSLRAMWMLDVETAREVRRGEKKVDIEEVKIEAECLRLLTLRHPFGTDFRFITFCLKVNTDIERVADHAASIAKITYRLAELENLPAWPRSLTELGERLPVLCHRLLRAVLDQDAQSARELVVADEVIDALDKRLFSEIHEMIGRHPEQAEAGLWMYRVGRELERVGDLMCNIAEDVVYWVTGEIIRHEKVILPES
ncbi:MAG: phosphate transport system regulatory protein PhoU [Phycisphaeraceae bacterium]|nr:MAG: phosphate transport system regulatory protein PhoU [Phycisphaeraceae bacterium]